MLMSWIWTGMVLLSLAASVLLGNGSELSGAVSSLSLTVAGILTAVLYPIITML